MDKYLETFIHALRSPLTAIFSNLQLIINGYVGEIDSESKKILEEVLFNAKYMEVLMKNSTDIFDDSQDLILQEINLSDIINDAIFRIKSSIENIEDILVVDVDKDIIINSYPDLLNRFFLVVLFELLKFANETNKLYFTVSKNNKIIIKFYYKSSNMDSKEISHIFDEIFFNPTQKHCQMNLHFFNMVLNKLNAEKQIIEKDNNIYLILKI